MSRTRMMLAVGLVGMLAALAFAQGSEPSAPRRMASQHESGTSIALLDEPTSLSCHAGWKPVCVIRDGEQACACHPVPGVATEPGKLQAAPASPAAPARTTPDRPAPPLPKLPSDTPPVATN